MRVWRKEDYTKILGADFASRNGKQLKKRRVPDIHLDTIFMSDESCAQYGGRRETGHVEG